MPLYIVLNLGFVINFSQYYAFVLKFARFYVIFLLFSHAFCHEILMGFVFNGGLSGGRQKKAAAEKLRHRPRMIFLIRFNEILFLRCLEVFHNIMLLF